MRFALLAALAALTCTASAQAACNLTQFSVTGATSSYDPFDVSFTPVPVDIRLQTDGSNDCKNARVQFALSYLPSSPQSGSHIRLKNAGSTLHADLQGPGGSSYPVSDPATAFQNMPTSFPLSRTGLTSGTPVLQLVVAPGNAVPPGPYTADLLLLARVTDKNNAVSNSSAPLPITVNVSPSVRLAAGSAGMMIDVGELTPNATGGPIHFDAYANIDYNLRLVSDNGFELVRAGHGNSREGIPYEPSISGIVADASSGNNDRTRKIAFTVPGGGGLRHQTLSVRILQFSGMRSGDYSDVLTIEIHAKI